MEGCRQAEETVVSRGFALVLENSLQASWPWSSHWQSWGTSSRSPQLHFKSCHGNFNNSR